MAITNMFKRMLEDKWPYGGGGCVLLSMKNIAPAAIYFPEGATVTSVTMYDEAGTEVVMTSANYSKFFVDLRTQIGNDPGISPGVGDNPNNSYIEESNPTTVARTSFSSGYLIPMFVPPSWQIVNENKGCVLGSSVEEYNSISDVNLPFKDLQYSNIINDAQDVNGTTKVTCVCQNKGTAAKTFTHIMLLCSASQATSIINSSAKFNSLFHSQSSFVPDGIRDYPTVTNSSLLYRVQMNLYYLDSSNVMRALYTTSAKTIEATTHTLYLTIKNNYPTLTSPGLQIVAPMIIETLDSPVTLEAGDSYKIEFTVDLSNREDWVRKRSDLAEGIYYYSGTQTGQYPAALEPEF